MNYRSLNHDEAAFVVHAFRQALLSSTDLSHAQRQFYKRSIVVLEQKLDVLWEQDKDPRPFRDQARDRKNQVQNPWPTF